jgi:hypothetical protein
VASQTPLQHRQKTGFGLALRFAADDYILFLHPLCLYYFQQSRIRFVVKFVPREFLCRVLFDDLLETVGQFYRDLGLFWKSNVLRGEFPAGLSGKIPPAKGCSVRCEQAHPKMTRPIRRQQIYGNADQSETDRPGPKGLPTVESRIRSLKINKFRFKTG